MVIIKFSTGCGFGCQETEKFIVFVPAACQPGAEDACRQDNHSNPRNCDDTGQNLPNDVLGTSKPMQMIFILFNCYDRSTCGC